MGIDDKTLGALSGDWKTSGLFSDEERLALELTDAMCATPAEVGDDLRARLGEQFTRAQLMELVSAIAWENHRARANRALGVKEMGFSDGAFCVLPHRPV